MKNCIIPVAKTKALISFAVTAKLICAFGFAQAKIWFSHEAAHMTGCKTTAYKYMAAIYTKAHVTEICKYCMHRPLKLKHKITKYMSTYPAGT